jgi:hypothetical protein
MTVVRFADHGRRPRTMDEIVARAVEYHNSGQKDATVVDYGPRERDDGMDGLADGIIRCCECSLPATHRVDLISYETGVLAGEKWFCDLHAPPYPDAAAPFPTI